MDSSKILYVVINLARSPERRKHMEAQLAQAGIRDQVEFFPAIDGRLFAAGKESGGYSPVEVRRLVRWVPYLRHRGFLWDHAACFLSHKAVWHRLLEDKDHDFYVVLEDDAYLHPAISSLVNSLIKHPNGDLVRLHTIQYVSVQAKQLQDLPAKHRLVVEYGPHPRGKLLGRNSLHTHQMIRNWLGGATGYLLSRKGAEILLAYSTDMRRPVDDHMMRFWEHNLSPLVVSPHPVRVNEAKYLSTIRSIPKSPHAHKERYAILPFYSASPRNLACRGMQSFLRRRDALRYRRSVRGLMEQFGVPDMITEPPTPAPFPEK